MLSTMPDFLMWMLIFVSFAVIALALTKIIVALIKGNRKQKTFNLISLACVLIMAISWFMNFGWTRFIFTFIPLPVVHIGAFLFICNFAAKHGEGKLDVMIAFAQITFVLFYLLLPDGGDAGGLYVLFGLIHNDAVATVCSAIASTIVKINIALLVILALKAKKAKQNATTEIKEEA